MNYFCRPQDYANAPYNFPNLFDENATYDLPSADCISTYTDDGDLLIEYYHSVYPYLGDDIHTWKERKITHMYIYSPEVHILGIKINDEKESLSEIMGNYGYEKRDEVDLSEYEIGRIISHYTGVYEDNQTDEIIDNFINSYEIVLYKKYDVDITCIIDKLTSLIYGMNVRVFNDNKLYYVYY